jgi:hypothetical protein
MSAVLIEVDAELVALGDEVEVVADVEATADGEADVLLLANDFGLDTDEPAIDNIAVNDISFPELSFKLLTILIGRCVVREIQTSADPLAVTHFDKLFIPEKNGTSVPDNVVV